EWLGTDGTLQASYPPNKRTLGASVLSLPMLARVRGASAPVMDAGIVDLTTFSAVATFAQPVHDSTGRLRGIVATDLLLSDLSASLQTVITAQAQQHQHLLISVVDAQGDL